MPLLLQRKEVTFLHFNFIVTDKIFPLFNRLLFFQYFAVLCTFYGSQNLFCEPLLILMQLHHS